MGDRQRINDLRRRLQKDPASIAFAQLAEECRRAGQYQESIEVCRAGLAMHPTYLSARVTLGRALIELNLIDDAQTELEVVLKSAPDNLAAIRGLAAIHHRRGAMPEALAQYRAALLLARNDPDLQRTVADLERIVESPKPPVSDDLLSFAEPPSSREPQTATSVPDPAPRVEVAMDEPALTCEPAAALPGFDWPLAEPALAQPRYAWPLVGSVQSVEDADQRERAVKTIGALERFLDAIHVPRTQLGA